jgi:hypothetical protein
MANGDKNLTRYEPFGPAIVVPIGPEGGSGQLPGQLEPHPGPRTRSVVSAVRGTPL